MGTLSFSCPETQLDKHQTTLNTQDIDLRLNETICIVWGTGLGRYAVWWGELRDRRAAELWNIRSHVHGGRTERERERGRVQHIGIMQEKPTPPPPRQSSWRQRKKEWKYLQKTGQKIYLKPLTGRRAFQYHQKSVNSGAQSLSTKLRTWQYSGEETGRIPQE